MGVGSKNAFKENPLIVMLFPQSGLPSHTLCTVSIQVCFLLRVPVFFKYSFEGETKRQPSLADNTCDPWLVLQNNFGCRFANSRAATQPS